MTLSLSFSMLSKNGSMDAPLCIHLIFLFLLLFNLPPSSHIKIFKLYIWLKMNSQSSLDMIYIYNVLNLYKTNQQRHNKLIQHSGSSMKLSSYGFSLVWKCGFFVHFFALVTPHRTRWLYAVKIRQESRK